MMSNPFIAIVGNPESGEIEFTKAENLKQVFVRGVGANPGVTIALYNSSITPLEELTFDRYVNVEIDGMGRYVIIGFVPDHGSYIEPFNEVQLAQIKEIVKESLDEMSKEIIRGFSNIH